MWLWPLPGSNRDTFRRGILNPLRLPFRQGALDLIKVQVLPSDKLHFADAGQPRTSRRVQSADTCGAMAAEKSASAAGTNLSFEPGPRVLVVGGMDPSGAAGIGADLKTLTAFGVFGAAAVTAVTVQNQHGVTDLLSMTASLVGAQMDAALSDSPCDVIKTGMLASIDIVHAVADRATRLGSSCRLVIDPVLVSTTGRMLLPKDAQEALLTRLLPKAALVTPNIPEATALTGVSISSVEEMGLAADHLLARGAGAVLVKGGHLIDVDSQITDITDLLRTADGEEYRLTHARLPGPGRRGTGCALASAISAGIAEGLTLRAAVERAVAYLQAALRESGPYLSARALQFAPTQVTRRSAGLS